MRKPHGSLQLLGRIDTQELKGFFLPFSEKADSTFSEHKEAKRLLVVGAQLP
jgi:hypothetical protein